ncbi:MAG: hypothetical protein ACI90V_011405, partial [Bacillariaceae sp.]
VAIVVVDCTAKCFLILFLFSFLYVVRKRVDNVIDNEPMRINLFISLRKLCIQFASITRLCSSSMNQNREENTDY